MRRAGWEQGGRRRPQNRPPIAWVFLNGSNSMDLRRVAAVLPCDGLGDFPANLDAQSARIALHNWTAAWRCELLATTGALPSVWSSYSPPDAETAQNALLLAPPLGASDELAEWRDQMRDADVLLVDSLADRSEIIAVLQRAGLDVTSSSQAWAGEFHALGYAYLQVELLTQNLVHASVINSDELDEQIIAAAKAAVAGHNEQVEQSLGTVYDLMQQVRDHAHPVTNYLIDLVLLGDTTLGERLDRELAEDTPKSFLLSPIIAQKLKQARGDLAPLFEQRCVAATIDPGPPLALAPPADLHTRVEAALSAAKPLAAQSPSFVLTESGLPPRLSSLLAEHESPLVVAPLDGACPPELGQQRLALSAPEDRAVETLIALPRDAASATTMLMHGRRLSELLYREDVVVSVLAAWAGCRCSLFEDLRCVARRSSVLGQFVTLGKFFHDTAGLSDPSEVEDDLLGPRWRELAAGEGERRLHAGHIASLRGVVGCASELARGEVATGGGDSESAVAAQLADVLGGSNSTDDALLVLNAFAHQRPVLVGDPKDQGLCDLVDAEYVRNVPGLGYRVANPTLRESGRDDSAPRASDTAVQNELLEALIDPIRGGVRGLRQQGQRRNRLSQKLTVRRSERLIEVPTNVEIESTHVAVNSHDRGAVRVTGSLFDLKQGRLARFTQTIALFANWNRLFVDVELDTTDATTGLDQLSFASRIALPDAQWRFVRGVQWSRLVTHLPTFLTTDYARVEEAKGSITIAVSTPTRHRRHGPRMLDSFLPHQQGTKSHCRLAYAIDDRRPLQASLDLAAQSLPCAAAPFSGSPNATGWVAHVDVASVQVAAIAPLHGEGLGVRLSVVETHGRAVDARARFARRPQAGWWLNAEGERAGPLDLIDEAVAVPLDAHEARRLEVVWG